MRKTCSRVVWAAMAAAFLMVPAAWAGDAPVLATLSVAQADFDGGASATGEAVAFTQLDRPLTGATGDTFSLGLKAAGLKVVVDEYVSDLTVGFVPLKPSRDGLRTDDHGPSSLTTTEVRPVHDLIILPVEGRALPQVTIESDRGLLGPVRGDVTRVESTDYVGAQPAPALSANVAGAREWAERSPAPATLTFTGDFWIVLYEADVHVTSDRCDCDYVSGFRQAPVDDPTGSGSTGAAQPAVVQDQTSELYIQVSSGTLTFTWPSLRQSRLFLGETSLDAHAVTFSTVSGVLADGEATRPVQARELDFAGALRVSSDGAAKGSTFAVTVAGEPTGVWADGEPLSWVHAGVATPASAFPSWISWLLVGLVAPSAATGYGLVRRLRQSREMRILAADMDEGAYDRVIERADRLVASKSFGEDASVMKALSLIQLHRLQDAARFLAALPPWTGPQAATQNYLHAYLHALKGERAPALERLQACLKISPEYQEEILANPNFSPLLDDPQLLAMLSLEAEATPPPADSSQKMLEGYA